jgi:predicted dehydrogenase
MIGIIGSGFGLYGHLPALCVGKQVSVLIPIRYKNTFQQRVELSSFDKFISWAKDENEVVNSCETVVIAIWPMGQPELIKKCLLSATVKNLILEKPLAVSPELSIEILEMLMVSGKNFRIMYSFIYTDWSIKITEATKKTDSYDLIIKWNFMAHHYRDSLQTWKKNHSIGGGAIRFYGIHLIAFLAHLGFKSIKNSTSSSEITDEVYEWSAQLCSEFNRAQVLINTKTSISEFTILLIDRSTKQIIYNLNLKDPFGDIEKSGELDVRVAINKTVQSSIDQTEEAQSLYKLYSRINSLWLDLEKANTFSVN